MGKRGAGIGVGLLLTVAACTSDPAPQPISSPSPASALSCTDSIDQPIELPAGYRLVGEMVAVPTSRVLQTAASGESDPAARLFAKWGLVVRTGQTVEIGVAAGWADKARVGWGNPGRPAASVRVTACPLGSPPAAWTAFAGGTWVAAPACVPLVIRAGGRTEQTRLPIGVPCP
jgi:hypothetical protein